MAIYEAAIRTTSTTTNTPLWELRAGAARPITILEIGVSMGAATASAVGLGRTATAGTASGTILGQALDPRSGAALGAVAGTWSAAPTVPAAYLRRFGMPATIGSGIIWGWGVPAQLALDATASIVLWALSAVGVMDVYAKWEE